MRGMGRCRIAPCPGCIGSLVAPVRDGSRRTGRDGHNRRAEVAAFLEQHAARVDDNGYRKVVRNGYMQERELITGIGRVPIKQPRVDDRQLAAEGEARFSSAILPRYLKRVASVDSLIPVDRRLLEGAALLPCAAAPLPSSETARPVAHSARSSAALDCPPARSAARRRAVPAPAPRSARSRGTTPGTWSLRCARPSALVQSLAH